MPSPFPGMNPYLEAPHIWEDFYQNLATEIRDQLAPKIEPRYYAALTPRVTYEEIFIEEPVHNVKPDVGVYVRDSGASPAVVAEIVAPPPLSIPVSYEVELKLWSVEIHATDYGNLVTAIEILSPVNKRPGHEAFEGYQRKRRDLMRAGISVVEIDLLRAGQRPITNLTRPLPDAPYFIFVTRGYAPSRTAVWPITLREAIPPVPVPLRELERDVKLDLTQAVHNIYDRARYARRINYSEPPPKPDLSPTDATWLQTHMAALRA